MTPSNAGGMSNGLARVRVRFVAELRVRRARLIELRSQLLNLPLCAEALKEIGQISHKIAGTAAILGFPGLGASASAIDDAIDQIKVWPTAPDPALLDRIDRMISDMELAPEKGDCT
ncbi:Hpt domain-containing protein [Roseovarius sp. Pro17]|uniref:Hpt domain-containing protein n=1 Tax=Roseovarius sp. Pro17 TaxID=3108175 RepID=UPI002D79D5BC|nr:Hpt domain-containing protein [Roseovarius sp. Pro17]